MQDLRATLEIAQQACGPEGAREAVRQALEEGQVLRVLALTRVVEVDQPEEPVADDERDAHLAGEAVLAVDLLLPLGQLRVVGTRNDHDLARRRGRHQGRVLLHVEQMSRCALVMAAAVVAHEAAHAFGRGLVDVAVRCADDLHEALGHATHHGVEVVAAPSEGAELDELVEQLVPPVHLLEEAAVLEGACRDLPQAADELKMLPERPRHEVGEFDDADDAPGGGEWEGQLGLVAPALQRGPGFGPEQGVVQAGHHRDLARLHRLELTRVPGQGHRRPLPVAVEPAPVEAHQAAHGPRIDQVDVDDGRRGELRQPLRYGPQDFVGGAQASGVVEARLDDGLEVEDAPFERRRSRPRGGSRWCGHGGGHEVDGRARTRLALAAGLGGDQRARLAGNEFGERDIGGGEGAREARLGQLHGACRDPVGEDRQHEQSFVAASPADGRGALVEKAGGRGV